MSPFHEKYKKEALNIDKLKPLSEGRVTWKCPSNIALVKYWGKRNVQLPMNSSLSLTLSECTTTTTINYRTKQVTPALKFFFEGKQQLNFEVRIKSFCESLYDYFPFLKHLYLEIHSDNSFPHSSGIASSASGMGALSLAICDIENQLSEKEADENDFFRKASFISRLGSGSACRSVYPKAALWGEHSLIPSSSDEIALPVAQKLHPVFEDYLDVILLIDEGVKTVSSSVGHQLMNKHPYAQQRFTSANENVLKLLYILESGNEQDFCELVEHEALSLHAMMMTSTPSFMLMKSGTITAIEKIRAFRQETKVMACFTLDAGANIHLLAPSKNKAEVLTFVESELKPLCQSEKYIVDKVGKGPEKLIEDYYV